MSNFLPCQFGIRLSGSRWWLNWGFQIVKPNSPLADYYQWIIALGPVSIFRLA